jgi:hypothetical protein
VDSTDSINFKRSRIGEIFAAIVLVPVGLFVPVGSAIALVDMVRAGQHPVLVVVSGLFAYAPLMFGAFGMLWVMAHADRTVTVSRHEIRVRRWLGGRRTVDLSSLAHIVMYGNPAHHVFLPNAGPPLLTVDAQNFAKAMPAAIEEHVRVQIDRLGEVDKNELQAKYPRNAKETAQGYDLDNQWNGRPWSW